MAQEGASTIGHSPTCGKRISPFTSISQYFMSQSIIYFHNHNSTNMCCCMYRGEQTGVLPDCYTYAPSTDNRQIGIHHVVVKLYDRMRPKMTIEQNCLFVMSWQLGQFVILNQLADKFIELLIQQKCTKLVLLREAILQTMFLHPGRCSIHPHRSLPHQCLD